MAVVCLRVRDFIDMHERLGANSDGKPVQDGEIEREGVVNPTCNSTYRESR